MKVQVSVKIQEGAMEKAIAQKVQEQTWVCGFNAPHAKWIEWGTDPHRVSEEGRVAITLWAKRKLGLSGKKLDETVDLIIWGIRKHGTAAHPFFRPAFDQVLTEVQDYYSKYGNDAPKELAYRLQELAVRNIMRPTADENGHVRPIQNSGHLAAMKYVERVA